MDTERKTVELSKKATATLSATFKQRPVEKSLDGHKWFALHDEKTSELLIKKLGLATSGMPIYDLNDSFKVWFDWSSETWLVSA
jgi:hypothetical protein